MAIKLTERSYVGNGVYRCDYVMDSDADAANLPAGDAPGSTAYAADETAHVWVKSPSNGWKPFGWGSAAVEEAQT